MCSYFKGDIVTVQQEIWIEIINIYIRIIAKIFEKKGKLINVIYVLHDIIFVFALK